jgi:NAD(P)-dependent dehydrogenase (short-subunit alcohol dehydrogenase family)
VDITGKVAVVTGANGDQGRAVTARYVASGASVVAVDLTFADDFEELVGGPERVRCLVADVADPAVIDAVRDALRPLGRCDVLYNNAALYLPRRGDGPADDVQLEVWHRVLDVNVTGALHMIRAVLPAMTAASGGVVINVASIAGVAGGPNIAYATSKGALITLTKSLGYTHGHLGIRAVALSLGPVDTQMMDHARNDPAEWSRILGSVPVGRAATPEEVAHWAVFLASDAASYANGANFVIDGGRILGTG